MRGAITSLVLAVLIAGGAIGGKMMMDGAQAEAAADPSGFDAMTAEAMKRMHTDMAVASTGDPDSDFAAMLVPHHQGAIDMAKAELLYGRDDPPPLKWSALRYGF